MIRSTILLFIVIIALIFITTAFASTASDTVPASRAGEDSDARSDYIVSNSDYTVSNIVYTYNIVNPSYIIAVDFDLSAAATSVEASLTADGSMRGCTNRSGFSWNCDVIGTTAAGSPILRVVVTQ